MADRTETRIHSEECNRVDWRSTLRYAATAKRRWERDIVRLLTLRRWVGTAFGTARFAELALSADDASLFRSVRPFHHWRDTKFEATDIAEFCFHFSWLRPRYAVLNHSRFLRFLPILLP